MNQEPEYVICTICELDCKYDNHGTCCGKTVCSVCTRNLHNQWEDYLEELKQ